MKSSEAADAAEAAPGAAGRLESLSRRAPPEPDGAVQPSRLLSRFNLAFSLMTVIPLLICCYVVTVRFFSIAAFEGLSGVYFLLAIVIALLGLLVGRQTIQEILRQLIGANAKLERLYNQQAAFVSNVAHEFRSPLTVIKGAVDNLVDGLHGPLAQDQRGPVSMCQREVARLKRLVGDLLDIARIESGKIRLTRERVVLQDLLREIEQLFSGQFKERGLSLAMDLPSAPVVVSGDADRLKQIFINLVGNAVKFTRRGGITVRLTKDLELIRVEVADTGEGIAQDDLQRIFDKFERVGSQAEEGSGLGLPIAKDLVELHQGRIWAESRLEHGSRFIVTLPAHRPGPGADDQTARNR